MWNLKWELFARSGIEFDFYGILKTHLYNLKVSKARNLSKSQTKKKNFIYIYKYKKIQKIQKNNRFINAS